MSNHNQKTGMFGNEDDAIRAARMKRLDESFSCRVSLG